MSAASVAVVVTSGERHEGKALQAWCCLQVKLCDPCLSALCVPWCEKALDKYSSFPFLLYVTGSMAVGQRRKKSVDEKRRSRLAALAIRDVTWRSA